MKLKIYPDKEVEFVDISSEQWRVYDFGDHLVQIDGPKWLYVSDNGHRLVDGNQISHYVPMGWIHLYWSVYPGEPPFVR